MLEISEVPGITGSTLDLFRAAGVTSVEILISNDVTRILSALDRANARNEVPVRRPSEDLVRAWQEAGRSVLRKRAERRPPATVVPEEDLRAAGIDVRAVPVAEVVPDPPASEEATPEPGRVEKKASPAPSRAEESAPPAPVEAAKAAGGRSSTPKQASREADKGTSAGAVAEAPPARPPSPPEPVEPPAKLPDRSINAPASQRQEVEEEEEVVEDVLAANFRKLEQVKEEKPQGERRNRGMSHPDAGRVRWAATVTTLAPLACLAAAGVLIWVLVRVLFYGDEFHPTIALLLLVFPVSLVFYLLFGVRVRCRLCGQRLFVPKHCHKHVRAAKSILGPTFAAARNAMLFASFRCMLCGTKTRLKD